MNPIRLAGCIIRNETGKILLLHRNKKSVRQWELPGGKLEKGETAETAAAREVREELGIEVTEVQPVGRASFQENGQRFSYEWFETKIADATAPSIGEPETFDNLQYWDIATLRQRDDLSENVKNLLKSGVLQPAKSPSYVRRMFTVIGIGYLFLAVLYASPLIMALPFPNAGEAGLSYFASLALLLMACSFVASLVMTAMAVHYIMQRRLLGPARVSAIAFVFIYICILYSPVILTIISNMRGQ